MKGQARTNIIGPAVAGECEFHHACTPLRRRGQAVRHLESLVEGRLQPNRRPGRAATGWPGRPDPGPYIGLLMVFPDTLAAPRVCQHGFSRGLWEADLLTGTPVPSHPIAVRN